MARPAHQTYEEARREHALSISYQDKVFLLSKAQMFYIIRVLERAAEDPLPEEAEGLVEYLSGLFK